LKSFSALAWDIISIGFIIRFFLLMGELTSDELEDIKALIKERPRPTQTQRYQYLK
jgi:hypothetical protein